MTGADLKTKQSAADIPGYAVCQVVGTSRARLSDIERGYVAASLEDLRRIDCGIEQILQTKQHLAVLAKEAGLFLPGIRL